MMSQPKLKMAEEDYKKMTSQYEDKKKDIICKYFLKMCKNLFVVIG